jgi:ribosomal protein L7Ae-like RNA K-turn-binding protein
MGDWLGLLGFGARAGSLAIGVDAVRTELQAGKLACVILADDASPRALEKVARLAVGKNIPVYRGVSADVLGQRLGRPPVMAAGVRDRKLADGIGRSAADGH